MKHIPNVKEFEGAGPEPVKAVWHKKRSVVTEERKEPEIDVQAMLEECGLLGANPQ